MRATLLLLLAGAAAAADPTWTRLVLTTEFHGEGAGVADLDRDGHPDVVSGPFWYPGPRFDRRRRYAEGEPLDPAGYSQRFFVFVDDVSGDGWEDVLVVGFPGEALVWHENPADPAADAAWPRHVAFPSVDNESPQWLDLTGDGRRELVCMSGGRLGWIASDADPRAAWAFHPCSPADARFHRFTHGLGVGDLDGDGRRDLLEAQGWWRQPASLAGDPDWEFRAHAFGDGGAQMHATDVDGDGDGDVVTVLQAHGWGLAWFERRDGGFASHVIMGDRAQGGTPCFSQPHALALADLDGDGLADLVSGKRFWAHGPHGDPESDAPAELWWWRCERAADGVRWRPQRIDDDSGVGTEVDVADADGDGLPDVVVGNKKGTFVMLQRRAP